jgi:hypothetical protein
METAKYVRDSSCSAGREIDDGEAGDRSILAAAERRRPETMARAAAESDFGTRDLQMTTTLKNGVRPLHPHHGSGVRPR